MSVVTRRGGVEMGRPEGFASLAPNVGTVSKLGGGLIIGAIGAVFSVVKTFRRVPEGSVGIRTFNHRAMDRHGRPLHPVLYPGVHWMSPLHDIDIINVERQVSPIETNADLVSANGTKTQYNIGANVTWGVKTGPPIKTWGRKKHYEKTGKRRTVEFDDAFRAFYALDTYDDQEEKVKGVGASFLVARALKLPEGKRDGANLERRASGNIRHVKGLGDYGLQIYGFDVSNFSISNIHQFGAPVQVENVGGILQPEMPLPVATEAA